jgi:hypothetical protein
MRSIAGPLRVDIEVPHFTTLSRKGNGLSLLSQTTSRSSAKQLVQLVVDSTVLKIFGEGEWLEKSIKRSANGALGASCTLA